MPKPVLKLYRIDGSVHDPTTELDLTAWVTDLNVEHEDLDADGSGRDVKTGAMIRTRIAQKHTITVKLRRLNSDIAAQIHDRLSRYKSDSNPFIYVVYHNPCSNSDEGHMFYCATYNWGSQRYNQVTDMTFYDGASFKLIQK